MTVNTNQVQNHSVDREQVLGVGAALLSTVFLGSAPIFGKLAFQEGLTAYTVVAIRTVIAAVLLWSFYAVFWRDHILVKRRELVGCIGVGLVNGIGSLF